MSYDDRNKIASSISIEEKKIYWEQCLEEKIKNIERTKRYASDQNGGMSS